MSAAGAIAEARAADYLTARGLSVIARNYRCRGGEIDLVCRDGASLVFVEVRLRTSRHFGGAAASITPAKQRRIVLAANHYLAGKPWPACRFDAVLLDGENIDWIRNAFDAS
ncbi:MAG: hypothetical protein MOGDAGHF_01069 [Rhodocyclaceae bacterium]|nr:hypothetical protein [Rhodocyclaceae bacterium]